MSTVTSDSAITLRFTSDERWVPTAIAGTYRRETSDLVHLAVVGRPGVSLSVSELPVALHLSGASLSRLNSLTVADLVGLVVDTVARVGVEAVRELDDALGVVVSRWMRDEVSTSVLCRELTRLWGGDQRHQQCVGHADRIVSAAEDRVA